MQYVPELTWLLFLRILDLRRIREADTAEVLRNTFIPSFAGSYRWGDIAESVCGEEI
jgi:type I restriction enzyme M protein